MLTSKNWRETADFGYDCPSHADCPEPRAAELAPPLPRLDAQHCNSPDCAGLGGAVVQSQGREQRRGMDKEISRRRSAHGLGPLGERQTQG